MGNVRLWFERLSTATVALLLAVGLLVCIGVANFVGYEAQWAETGVLPGDGSIDGPDDAVLSEVEIESASRLFPGLVGECSLSEGLEPQGFVSTVLETVDAVSRSGESFIRACVAGISRQ